MKTGRHGAREELSSLSQARRSRRTESVTMSLREDIDRWRKERIEARYPPERKRQPPRRKTGS